MTVDAEQFSPRVALVGNPNSGKTALFNALTGGRAQRRRGDHAGRPAGDDR